MNLVLHIRVAARPDLSGKLTAYAEWCGPLGDMAAGSTWGHGETPGAAVRDLLDRVGTQLDDDFGARKEHAREQARLLDQALKLKRMQEAIADARVD